MRVLWKPEEDKEGTLHARVVVAKARRKQKPGGMNEEVDVVAATMARAVREIKPAGRSAIMAVMRSEGGREGRRMSLTDLKRIKD